MSNAETTTATGLLLDDDTVLRLIDADGDQGPGAGSQHPATLSTAAASFVVVGHRPAAVVSPRRIDPTVAALALAQRHPALGIVVAATPADDHPYNLARRLLSIDHLTGGRIGLLLDGSADTAAAHEFADAVARLWESFPRDALVGDRESGRFADTDRIVRPGLTGEGRRWRIAGALNSPTSVQGRPPLLWWGDAPAPSDADGVLTADADPGRVNLRRRGQDDGADLPAAPTLRGLLNLPLPRLDTRARERAFAEAVTA